MVDHRDPPKPAGWEDPKKGTCRFCGLPVLNGDGTTNTRSQWHPICVIDYQMIHWPSTTRKAVWMRDAGRCATCGHQCQRRGTDVWHLDHIQPLIEARGDIRFWMMDNLQTLCQTCHHAKTGREATQRAAARRSESTALDPTLFEVRPSTDDQTLIRDKLYAREQRRPTRPPRGARRRR